MAITIHQSPSAITPTYNDMIWVVGSTNVAQTNFKYIVDVWYNGAFQSRFKMPSRPDTYCVFNAQRVIESLITYDLSYSDSEITTCPNMFENVVLKFGEEYGSTVVEYLNLTASSVVTAFNASLGVTDFLDFDYADYNISTNTKKFLTNSPTQDIQLDEKAWLYFYSTTGANVNRAIVKTYNTAGALIATYKVANNYASASGFFRFPCGTTQLNDIAGGDLISGAQPLITTSVKSFTINMATSADSQTSELKTFTIVDENCKYDKYRLHWLNELGGFDSYSFTLVSINKTSVNRKSYQKNLGTLTGTAYAYTKADRVDNVYDITYKDTVRVTSDWMDDVDAVWIKQLFTSPIVFYENSTGELIPISISSSDYEKKKKQNTKLINYDLEFSFAVTNSRQRG